MEDYSLAELLAAKKSLTSTLNKINKALVSLEEKQAGGGKLKSQITLSKERVKALTMAIVLIDREITNMNKDE